MARLSLARRANAGRRRLAAVIPLLHALALGRLVAAAAAAAATAAVAAEARFALERSQVLQLANHLLLGCYGGHRILPSCEAGGSSQVPLGSVTGGRTPGPCRRHSCSADAVAQRSQAACPNFSREAKRHEALNLRRPFARFGVMHQEGSSSIRSLGAARKRRVTDGRGDSTALIPRPLAKPGG
jgi:hypothetical protein